MQETVVSNDLWIRILEQVEPLVKRPHFLTWFQNTTLLHYEEGVLRVGVPNLFAKDWLEQKLNGELFSAILQIEPSVVRLDVEVDPQLSMPGDVRRVDVNKLFASDKKARKLPNRQEVKLIEGISSKCLNPKYRLDKFIVGPSNRLAHAACMAVSQSPGRLYNPLFIYGGVGLGKTHLLQAIGNEIIAYNPEKVVVYITSERFTNEIVEAIGKRNSKSFKDRYRKVDCLIIDDVQFLANKDRTQEEFFHTFNELYDNNKQIVISSDRPPKELNLLEDRLVSRFEMGMIVDVQFPDYETRLAILHTKCREHEVLIHPEVLEFIALNVHDSVRELEGVLIQAIAQAQLEHSTPTVRSVAKILKKIGRVQDIHGVDAQNLGSARNLKTSMDVIELVAQHYKLAPEDLLSESRKRQVIVPRQVAMYLIRNELGLSYEQIGEDFGGKNHTTVLHSCEKMEDLLNHDKILLRDIHAIKKEMGL